MPDERWGEAGHAYLVATDGGWDARALAAALAGSLAAYKIPRYVTVVPDLPRTATGKIRKEGLRGSSTLPSGRAPEDAG